LGGWGGGGGAKLKLTILVVSLWARTGISGGGTNPIPPPAYLFLLINWFFKSFFSFSRLLMSYYFYFNVFFTLYS
jgi:hypothetical protein